MRVTIGIPYRGGQIDRELAYSYTRTHLEKLLPGVPVVVADSGHQPFNRAASRNEAVRQAGQGIVIVCDADTLPEREPLEAAVEAARDGVLHLPYTVFHGLTREHSLAVLVRGAPLAGTKPLLESTSSVGGTFVIDHDAYSDAGGQDERFIGWGGEDVAFRHACDALLGQTVRHAGMLYGLWHPSEMNRQSRQFRQNIARQNRYRGLRTRPGMMRQLIEDPE